MEKKLPPIPEDMVGCLQSYFNSKEFDDDLGALFEEVQQIEHSANPEKAAKQAEMSQPLYGFDSVVTFFKNAIEDTDECKDILKNITEEQIKVSAKKELDEIRKNATNPPKDETQVNKKEVVEIFKYMIMNEFKHINSEFPGVVERMEKSASEGKEDLKEPFQTSKEQPSPTTSNPTTTPKEGLKLPLPAEPEVKIQPQKVAATPPQEDEKKRPPSPAANESKKEVSEIVVPAPMEEKKAKPTQPAEQKDRESEVPVTPEESPVDNRVPPTVAPPTAAPAEEVKPGSAAATEGTIRA